MISYLFLQNIFETKRSSSPVTRFNALTRSASTNCSAHLQKTRQFVLTVFSTLVVQCQNPHQLQLCLSTLPSFLIMEQITFFHRSSFQFMEPISTMFTYVTGPLSWFRQKSTLPSEDYSEIQFCNPTNSASAGPSMNN